MASSCRGRRCPLVRGPELPVDEPANRACAIRLDPDQHAGLIGSGFVVGEWLAIKVLNHSAPAVGRIDRLKALGQRPVGTSAMQSQHLSILEERLDRPPQLCPILDLFCDRALSRLRHEPCIMHYFVGESDRLAHTPSVAYCCRLVNLAGRRTGRHVGYGDHTVAAMCRTPSDLLK